MTNKPARPVAVTVGYHTLPITYMDEKTWLKHHDETMGGFSWWGKGIIHIRLEASGEPMHENSLREVLIHEIMHMCYEFAGMNKVLLPDEPQDLEEQIVAMMSPHVFAVLRSNPKVAAYLMA